MLLLCPAYHSHTPSTCVVSLRTAAFKYPSSSLSRPATCTRIFHTQAMEDVTQRGTPASKVYPEHMKVCSTSAGGVDVIGVNRSMFVVCRPVLLRLPFDSLWMRSQLHPSGPRSGYVHVPPLNRPYFTIFPVLPCRRPVRT